MALTNTDSLSALTVLTQIGRGSSEIAEPQEEQAPRYRQLLDNILASLLNDSEKALEDKEHTQSVLERLLECVHHCVQALPFLFLPDTGDGHSSDNQDALRMHSFSF